MNIMVTGGAGYIGSVVAEELLRNDFEVVVLDNLQQGHRDNVPNEATFFCADCGDIGAIGNILKRFDIDAVVHMAAESIVEHSMTDPGRFFRNNVVQGIKLLDTMIKNGVRKLVFSSSAAVYGNPETIPIQEDHPTKTLYLDFVKQYHSPVP